MSSDSTSTEVEAVLTKYSGVRVGAFARGEAESPSSGLLPRPRGGMVVPESINRGGDEK